MNALNRMKNKQSLPNGKNKTINLNNRLGLTAAPGAGINMKVSNLGAFNETMNLSYKGDQSEKGIFATKLNKPVLGLNTHIFGPNPTSIMP